jgi:hypothetical protein
LSVDLGELDNPWLHELRHIAPTAPQGQKRVLSIARPIVYRMRVSTGRGVTWVDEERGVVWLCAVHRRADGSDDDAYVWFAKLHSGDRLLPREDDHLRDRAESALRLFRILADRLQRLLNSAMVRVGVEQTADLGNYLPCRVLVRSSGGVQEIWCALSVELEARFPDAVFEFRMDWPEGEALWCEVVRLGLR